MSSVQADGVLPECSCDAKTVFNDFKDQLKREHDEDKDSALKSLEERVGIVAMFSVNLFVSSSVVLPIYKGKGDPMECGSYRGIKLLEHAMKVIERIFEHRIRQQIKIDDMQFGFMKGKWTTDAIFMARQMQENFRVKGKKLFLILWIWRKLLIGCQEKW